MYNEICCSIYHVVNSLNEGYFYEAVRHYQALYVCW